MKIDSSISKLAASHHPERLIIVLILGIVVLNWLVVQRGQDHDVPSRTLLLDSFGVSIKQQTQDNEMTRANSQREEQASGVPPRIQQNQGNDEIHHPQLDFLVAGFPKSGTTTLLYALGKHPEIAMDSVENCELTRPSRPDDEVIEEFNEYLTTLKNKFLTDPESLRKKPAPAAAVKKNYSINNNNNATDFKLGIKCPNSVQNFRTIHRLSQHSPNCKFVFGLRHPIWFLQSYYNYRVLEAHLKDRVNNGIPSLSKIYDEEIMWYGISPDVTRYDIFLAQFGKAELTVPHLKHFISKKDRLAFKPNQFRIYLYTMEQLEDKTQSEILRHDLQNFLELRNEIDDIGHENKIWGDKPGSIHICHSDYDDIRADVLEMAEETVKWMDSFLDSPDVFASDLQYVRKSIRRWTIDPCDQSKD